MDMVKSIIKISPDGKTVNGVERRSWIKDVDIPEGVTVIGRGVLGLGVFQNCFSLESIHLPNSLLEIQYNAFEGCSSLRFIRIPPNVKMISTCTFNGCKSLNSINVDSDNQFFTSEDGILFDKEKSVLVRFPPCSSKKTYSIPNNVKTIGAAFCDCEQLHTIDINKGLTLIGCYAFAGCKSLKSISIPEGVTHIGSHAFADCSALSSVYIPDSVTDIGEYAFKNCKSLKTISLPKSCKELKKKTFSGCSSLLSVILPEGINQIWGAFSDCVSIKSMVLPESTTQLVGSTFWGCSSLLEITIPKKITSISWAAFIDCHSLQSFIVSKDNPVFSSDEGILFSKSKNEIVRYPPAKIGSTYIIPNEIEHISHCAFQGCKHLQTLILNSNVVSIGDSAFSSCSLLNSLFLSKSIKNIGRSILGKCDSLDSIKCNIDNINEINLCPDAFDGIDYSKVKLIIPEKTKETYTSHPTFSKFQNIIETETISPISVL